MCVYFPTVRDSRTMSAPPPQTFTVNNGAFTYIARDQVNHNYPSFPHPVTSHADTDKLNRYPQDTNSTRYPSDRPQQSDEDIGTTYSQGPDAEYPQISTAPVPAPSSMPGFEVRTRWFRQSMEGELY